MNDLNVTNIDIRPIMGQKTLRASGKVEINKGLLLSFVIMDSKNGPFVSWEGTKQYDKKDGTKGYSSPIFIRDEEKRNAITNEIVNKYKLEAAGSNTTESMSDSAPF